jgi:hypothetical protein
MRLKLPLQKITWIKRTDKIDITNLDTGAG